MNFFEYIQPYIGILSLIIIPIAVVFLERRSQSKALLLSARKEAYQKFILEYASLFQLGIVSGFHSSFEFLKEKTILSKNLDKETLDAVLEIEDILETKKYRYNIRDIFLNCKLVANSVLWKKLHSLETVLFEEKGLLVFTDEKKDNYYIEKIGLYCFEIEMYMRYDLGAIGFWEIFFRKFYFWYKKKILSLRTHPLSSSILKTLCSWL